MSEMDLKDSTTITETAENPVMNEEAEKAQETIKEEIQNPQNGSVSVNEWSHERRQIKEKRKKIRLTILLILLLFIAGGTAGYMVYNLKQDSTDTMVQPFDVINEFTNPMLSGSQQRVSTFSEKLCVLDTDVPMESSLLVFNQKGLLFDLSNRRVLFAQGVYDRVYPASITKIMTAMLALRYGNMSDLVYITPENLDLEQGSQVCGFRVGDSATMEQLLNCLLVYSGNDAAAAIAEHVGGTTENFVKMMNDYARELGCTGTHFTNPHGLTDEDHFTTVYDIYLMLREAMKYPLFTEICQQGSYTVNFTRANGDLGSAYLPATDHYLTGEANAPKNVTILGGKTGTTSLAGNCLALLCQDAYGKPFCSIVMGAKEKEDLYVQMNSLLQNVNN